MNPVSVQFSGTVTDIRHDERPGHVTIRYRTLDDVDGRVQLSHDVVDIHRISAAYIGKPLKLEYHGVRPVAVKVGRKVILPRPNSGAHRFDFN